MHTNVWAEDLDTRVVRLVMKKGYIGLQIMFDAEGQHMITFWARNQGQLAAIFGTFSAVAEKGVVFE